MYQFPSWADEWLQCGRRPGAGAGALAGSHSETDTPSLWAQDPRSITYRLVARSLINILPRQQPANQAVHTMATAPREQAAAWQVEEIDSHPIEDGSEPTRGWAAGVRGAIAGAAGTSKVAADAHDGGCRFAAGPSALAGFTSGLQHQFKLSFTLLFPH